MTERWRSRDAPRRLALVLMCRSSGFERQKRVTSAAQPMMAAVEARR
jgi:hypothetical protein